jgi:hypothetical protein
MAAPFLELHVVTRRLRHEIVPRLRDAIARAGGWITDYREFSNKSVCVNFEIEEIHCADLLGELLSAGCAPQPEAIRILEQAQNNGRRVYRGTLEVTLVHDEPDRKAHVPAVPG